MKVSVAVIGAGPAGLAGAIAAARNSCNVRVFERMPRPGLKLLASGGGHCNISNLGEIEDFILAYGRHGRFTHPALSFFSPQDLIVFFRKLGVEIGSPDGFHLYPDSGKASDILRALLCEAERLGIKVSTSSEIKKVIVHNGKFKSLVVGEEEICFDRLLIASGGAGYPSLGGAFSGYQLAESIGHRIICPVPGLCEIRIIEPNFSEISGVSLPNASISFGYGKKRFVSCGEILFTHEGVSGPAALNASGKVNRMIYESEINEIALSFNRNISSEGWLVIFNSWRKSHGKRKISTLLAEKFPLSLARLLCRIAGLEEKIAAELKKDEAARLAGTLSGCRIIPAKEQEFQKAMVTSGGVSLTQVDPHSMQSKLCKGVFFAGEILDIDGPCGGYNLQWAFSSGWLAGNKLDCAI